MHGGYIISRGCLHGELYHVNHPPQHQPQPYPRLLTLPMAPSTRLGIRPERRVDYRQVTSAARPGSSAANPIVLGDTPPPPEIPAARPTKSKKTSSARPARDALGRFIKSDTPKTEDKKVVKSTPPPNPKKQIRTEKECVICATSKSIKRDFKTSGVETTCEHWETVCDLCIQKQVQTKMSARELTGSHLTCMYARCQAVLDHTALSQILSEALFEKQVCHVLPADTY